MSEVRPQELVERALQVTQADDCIVLVTASHTVNMRWANNTLTTNGTTRSHDATVISILNGSYGPQVASMSRSGVGLDDIVELAEESAAAAGDSPPADDAAPLVRDRTATDWADAPAETSVGDFAGVTEGLAAAFAAANSQSEGRYGYAEHSVGTLHLGASAAHTSRSRSPRVAAGGRLPHVQPRTRVELPGWSGGAGWSAWAGTSTG